MTNKINDEDRIESFLCMKAEVSFDLCTLSFHLYLKHATWYEICEYLLKCRRWLVTQKKTSKVLKRLNLTAKQIKTEVNVNIFQTVKKQN